MASKTVQTPSVGRQVHYYMRKSKRLDFPWLGPFTGTMVQVDLGRGVVSLGAWLPTCEGKFDVVFVPEVAQVMAVPESQDDYPDLTSLWVWPF